MDVLIVGAGDIARRALPALLPQHRVHALVHRPAELPVLERLGAVPVSGDLDNPASLMGLAGLADAIVDLVSTGGTLRANRLVEVEQITEISSRLIVNQAAYKLRQPRLSELIQAISEAAGGEAVRT